MRNYLPELLAAALLPLLLMQGRRTRRRTPRLPEAGGPASGYHGQPGPAPLKLLAIGESPVAGVGVVTQDQAITGCLAAALAEQSGRPVAWRAHGRNGVVVRDAVQQLLPELAPEPVDVALVAFGVNDTTAFRSVSAWRSDMTALLDGLRARCQPRLTLVSGVPEIGRFPALPPPLRTVLGLKAAALDRALARLARDRPDTLYVALRLDAADPTLMAHDGYHPSAAGCQAWARLLAASVPVPAS